MIINFANICVRDDLGTFFVQFFRVIYLVAKQITERC